MTLTFLKSRDQEFCRISLNLIVYECDYLIFLTALNSETFFLYWGFPSGIAVKNPSASEGYTRDLGSIPGLGRSPGKGNGNPLQYHCLEKSMDREAWRAAVHGVTWLSKCAWGWREMVGSNKLVELKKKKKKIIMMLKTSIQAYNRD